MASAEGMTVSLKDRLLAEGADLVGVADAGSLSVFQDRVPEIGTLFRSALALATSVDRFRVSGQEGAFRRQIIGLEELAVKTALRLNEMGFSTLIIHPEDCFDHRNLAALVPNKAVARMAGLGWIGRCLLLTTSRFGPRVRLVSVFTDAPLKADKPVPNGCGSCCVCVERCPTGALCAATFGDYPSRREDVLNTLSCEGAAGCDVCMQSCPLGQPVENLEREGGAR